LVGTARFELATPCTPSKCATRLRYVPTAQQFISNALQIARLTGENWENEIRAIY
jgi:hypothetical protein